MSSSAISDDIFEDVDPSMTRSTQSQAHRADKTLLSEPQNPFVGMTAWGFQFDVPSECIPAKWFLPALERLSALSRLPRNWDSYGASPIDPRCLVETIVFLCRHMSINTALPQIVPVGNGSIQIEWHRNGIDFEALFIRPGVWEYYYRNSQSQQESEFVVDGASSGDQLQEIMSQLIE
jgi:hypothetical protein